MQSLGDSKSRINLEFRADASVRLPQHIYAVSHGQLGPMEIFLVQIGADYLAFGESASQ
ncbi:MAG TPA: hypothetical protein VGY91_13300 [Chthoniobacterales bacterium]|jgi:hypothetical protein|nr:hypothetical protein [Chthoniobacterales bacterium]